MTLFIMNGNANMDLSDERYQELNRLLGAFTISLLQDCITFNTHCERQKISLEEVVLFIQRGTSPRDRMLKNEVLLRDSTLEKLPFCPVCKEGKLRLEEINNHPARMIDDHSHSWWTCPDPDCDFDPEISDKHPYEILSDLGVMVRKSHKRPSQRKKAAMKKLNVNKRG